MAHQGSGDSTRERTMRVTSRHGTTGLVDKYLLPARHEAKLPSAPNRFAGGCPLVQILLNTAAVTYMHNNRLALEKTRAILVLALAHDFTAQQKVWRMPLCVALHEEQLLSVSFRPHYKPTSLVYGPHTGEG